MTNIGRSVFRRRQEHLGDTDIRIRPDGHGTEHFLIAALPPDGQQNGGSRAISSILRFSDRFFTLEYGIVVVRFLFGRYVP